MNVVLSTENTTPLAVVYYGGELGKQLKIALEDEHVRVLWLTRPTDILPVWEKPDYVFFFVSGKSDKLASFEQWSLGQEKTVVILEHGQKWEQTGKNVVIAELLGRVDESQNESVAKRLINFAFAGNEKKLLIIGHKLGYKPETKRLTRTFAEIWTSFEKIKKNKTNKKIKKLSKNLIILLTICLIISPFLWLEVTLAVGFLKLRGAVVALKNGDTLVAAQKSQQAIASFGLAKGAVWLVRLPYSDGLFSLLNLGERGADLTARLAVLIPKAKLFAQDTSKSNDLRLELEPINQDLGLIEGQIDQVLSPKMINILGFFGVTPGNLSSYKKEVKQMRVLVEQADEILGVMDQIIPSKAGIRKTYLVVLQNSAELRPTGGFIGSYVLVNFEEGKLANYKVYDIYAADGQLRGFVAPPDEILHYLGQTQWFMRDANWAVDWPLTGQRLEWFLEKETGQKVDGVVGLSLGAVEKILAATGPLFLPDRQETITADNFFEKAEYASEINFFPGSDQKPQFLAQVASQLLTKIKEGNKLDYLNLGQAVMAALVEKDVIIYVDNPTVEKILIKNSWGGTITPIGCEAKINNCLMVVDANLGANKTNYFLKRSFRADSVISKGGEVDTTLVIKYQNNSPSASWPGGVYKNYLRVLVPPGSILEKIDFGDKRVATISSVLTADVIKAVLPDQFLVFKSVEKPYNSYGTFFEVPIGERRTVTFKYRPVFKLDFTSIQMEYFFKFLRQPGAGLDVLDFSLDYPSFLMPVLQNPVEKDVSLLALPQKLIYNTEINRDREIKVNFKR